MSEPFARVRYYNTGGNVGLSWHAIPVESLPYHPKEGEPLYSQETVETLRAELAEARLQQKAWGDKWDHAISRAEAAEAELVALRAHVNAFYMGTPESRLLAMTKERDALREMVDSTKVAAWDKCAEIISRAQAAEAERDRLREAVEVLQKDVHNLTQKVIPNIRKERDDTEAELAEARRDVEALRASVAELDEANSRFGQRQEWWNERMFTLEQERDRLRAELAEARRDVEALRTELREATDAMDDPAINNIVTLPEAIRALVAEYRSGLEADR